MIRDNLGSSVIASKVTIYLHFGKSWLNKSIKYRINIVLKVRNWFQNEIELVGPELFQIVVDM